MKIKYKIKKSYKIAQLLLISIGFILTIIRWSNAFNNNVVVINSEITSHISNFSLSLLAYLAIGSSWITSGVKFRFVTVLGIFMIAANFICETLMGFMNTVDIVDAIYGTVGVMLVFIYFYFLNNKGLIEINSDNQ
ncbi:hypothetical protein K8M07_10210 [Schnuerera sp. xch1]|uniref:hypothetical protein n=1 Tax=Schnuerera sp. xch1 TaxID=2874283 RepID=UPI001CBCA71E|nr:hypothetical protein [Schnuerera sp. xch1]MBZ2175608.1 hypothetical protein [Schnuerera sp. xch1]